MAASVRHLLVEIEAYHLSPRSGGRIAARRGRKPNSRLFPVEPLFQSGVCL